MNGRAITRPTACLPERISRATRHASYSSSRGIVSSCAANGFGPLVGLRRFAGGEKVILIWDHLPAHRSREMKQFLRSQWQWLQIEWLPRYAPDLNPTEGVWNNIKGKELANLCPDHIDEATVAFRRGLHRLSHASARRRGVHFEFLVGD